MFTVLLLLTACDDYVKKTDGKDQYTGWDKPAWIHDAIKSIKNKRYPKIKAISWWHEIWENEDSTYSDLRINSSAASLAAFKEEISDNIFTSTPVFTGGKLQIPSDSKIYFAAFPYFANEEDVVTASAISDFEKLAGRQIAWAYFSNNWITDITFPADAADIIHNAGKVPFIRLMARSDFEDPPDPVYTLQNIINGDYDKKLIAWAENAAGKNYEILIEFGTEVNGDWFSWNGRWNGAGTANGYGDINLADGPERFRDAYRHIIDLFNAAGADNVTWFFHIDVSGQPDESWNDITLYYPGDNYIDWIGISCYGPMLKNDDYETFTELMDKAYPEISSLAGTKPIALLEFAIAESFY